MDWASLLEDMWLNILTAPVLLEVLEVAAMTVPLMLGATLDHMWLEWDAQNVRALYLYVYYYYNNFVLLEHFTNSISAHNYTQQPQCIVELIIMCVPKENSAPLYTHTYAKNGCKLNIIYARIIWRELVGNRTAVRPYGYSISPQFVPLLCLR